MIAVRRVGYLRLCVFVIPPPLSLPVLPVLNVLWNFEANFVVFTCRNIAV